MNLLERARKVAEDIKALRIQGATNVALAAVNVFKESAPARIEELKKAAELLKTARSTEPLLFNAIDFILAAEDPREAAEEIYEVIKASWLRAAENLAEILSRYEVVQTICHSSVVEAALKMVQPKKVVVTETRPRFQGRITARKLVEAGITVVFAVDSAMLKLMEEEAVGVVAIGNDAIYRDGSVANKIGSRLLAEIAASRDLPLYSAGPSLKIWRIPEKVIEERPAEEVWKEAPSRVIVRNPAFEIVPAKYIHKICTELGNLEPSVVYSTAVQKYFRRNT